MRRSTHRRDASPDRGVDLAPAADLFVGRAHDLAAVVRAVQLHAIVTLTGPGGVGKTCLARRVAQHLAPTYSRGARRAEGAVRFCDLSEAHAERDVRAALARATGVAARPAYASGDEASDARLGRSLAALGDALIVLDNVEQVALVVRRMLVQWIAVAPRVRWLLTSREPLGLAEERRHAVRPLAVPDGVALFKARAHAAAPDAVLDERDAAALEQLVRRLDALPLAIELAAARVEVLAPAEMVARLTQRFDVLHAANIRVPRHTTLRATIDWSWNLLAPAEQAALAQSAVFRGGFALAAAEHVIAPPGDGAVLDVIHALCRKSLVGSTRPAAEPTRFALLESVRAYASERLDGSSRAAAQGRHAAYYLRELEARTADARREGLDALYRWSRHELDNLIAAFRYAVDQAPELAVRLAVAMDPVLYVCGPYELHRELLDQAVAIAAARAHHDAVDDGRLGARLLHARGRVLRVRDELGAAVDDFHAAAALARRAGDRGLEAQALRMLGVVERQRGRPERAQPLLTQALEAFRGARDAWSEGVVLDDLGVVRHDLGELAAARRAYDAALVLHRTHGDRRYEGIVRGHLGVLAHDEGRLADAHAHLAQALALHAAVGDQRFEGFARIFLGDLLRAQGESDAAARELERAVAIYAAVGDGYGQRYALGSLAGLLASRGELARAEALFAQARVGPGRDAEHGLAVALDIMEGALDLARAQHAASRGDPAGARAYRAACAARLEPAGAGGPGTRFVEARLAARVLRAELAAYDACVVVDADRAADRPVAAARAGVTVAHDGRWFRTDAGARVSLARRPSLAGVLAALAAHREGGLDAGLSLATLFAAGWPGQKASTAAAARRVYVAIDTLRRLGLRDVLRRGDDGYALDESVGVAGLDGVEAAGRGVERSLK